MKFKSILAAISINLLALVLIIAFSSQIAAQKTYNKPKTMAGEKTAAARKDADYWFNKGALCATYGNDRIAIKYFQKAISLNPNRSGAYFAQGISYGQLGEFDPALARINQALEMDPQNGLYLYGRGRVYLLAGKQEQAMEDFKRAAELDDEDAQTYLKTMADAE
jgi:tetratricopeptide (TPR) repeat protein